MVDGRGARFSEDFQIYEELIARSASGRRRKPFEAANHPFCGPQRVPAGLVVSGKARVAASRALTSLEELTEQVVSGTQVRGRARRLSPCTTLRYLSKAAPENIG